MDIRLLAFDWDQTLWDSWEVHRQSIRYAAERKGIANPTQSKIVSAFSSSLEEHLLRVFGPDYDGSVEHYLDFYSRHHLTMSRLFPKVADALRQLKDNGLHLALLSNKQRSEGYKELGESGLSSLFYSTMFRGDMAELKPNPDGLLHVLSRTGISPQRALYIGDTPNDIEFASRAGVGSVAALWGNLDKEALLAQNPDHVWQRIEDALAALDIKKK